MDDEMLILPQGIEVILNPSNVKHYESKGYFIPRYMTDKGKWVCQEGTTITVNVEDLTGGCNEKVKVQCDCCGVTKLVAWFAYKRTVKDDLKCYCHPCALSGKKISTSFYAWCYLHLTKEIADALIARWNTKLNRNKSPEEVSYASGGYKGKGFWFNCTDHPEHLPELKMIDHFTCENKNLDCNQCNTVSITHPHLIKFFLRVEDAFKYSKGVRNEVPMKCPRCGEVRTDMRVSTLVYMGFSCPKCSDGFKYPEKFMSSLLDQRKETFITQLTKKTLPWVGNYKYDDYLPKRGIIIETHGLQHYEQPTGSYMKGTTLKKTQQNDADKKERAEGKGMIVVTVDCRKSTLEWIRDSIMQSELPVLLGFVESDIDWYKCHEKAFSSLVETCSTLWRNGTRSSKKIAVIVGIHPVTVSKYLKQGAVLGWCDYNADAERRKGGGGSDPIRVTCLTTNEEFDSMAQASLKYGVQSASISKCCSGKLKSTGGLVWVYSAA